MAPGYERKMANKETTGPCDRMNRPQSTNTHRHYIQYEPLEVKRPGGKRHRVSAKPRAGEMGPGSTAAQKG